MASQYGLYPHEPLKINDLFNITLSAMIYTSENDILFDDLTALENKLGVGALTVISVNTNCDCSSYCFPSNPDDCDTDQSTSTALTFP